MVVILDVGRTMCLASAGGGARFGDAVKAVTMLLQQKILYGKKDEIGVVLFGTAETKNTLATALGDGEQYQHVTVLHEIGPATVDVLRSVMALDCSVGGATADFIDALVVAMDMIVRKTGKKRYQRRVFLVTDAGSPANASDLQVVVQQFNNMEAHLNVIGIDFQVDGCTPPPDATASQHLRSKVKTDNERLLHKIADNVNGVVIPVSKALELMSYFRSKSVLQRSIFRGRLEISPIYHIAVWSFIKTTKQSFPTLKRISSVSAGSATPGSMQVRQERTLQSLQDPDANVSREEAIKGYKYGKTLVPFSKVDEAALKLSTERCMRMIGFTEASSVQRYHYMGPTEMMVGWPGDTHALTAFSALVRAMAETDRVGIFRYVKTKNSAPKLAVCIPHVKHDLDCLYVQLLPFAENLRSYQFPPMNPTNSATKKAYIPSPEQLVSAAKLITSFDLMTSAVNEDGEQVEDLKPKEVYNPVLQRFYQCVAQRALDPAHPISVVDPAIDKLVKPNERLVSQAAPALEAFAASFPLQKSEAAAKLEQRSYWRDQLQDAARDVTLDSYTGGSGAAGQKTPRRLSRDLAMDLSIEKLIASGVTAVGSVTPVKDFEEMMQRRDVDLVIDAVTQLRKRIMQLINDSIQDTYYGKTLECVVALRKGCVMEDEFQQFNTMLQDMRFQFENKTRNKFWQLVVEKGLSLIHNQECVDSPITPKDSAEYLGKPLAAAVVSDMPKAEEPGVEQLFDMIE
eukprot:TRINITY_DN2353_c0_g1_i3.p1 TRINITY_DN2353_c0_g1~~TRINITY_DN2353_c0_g1_i3.p1  ORF type:complete len:753 (-),score=192.03 TRINITY_DN2353_c0_g1_i3:99-2321(-)